MAAERRLAAILAFDALTHWFGFGKGGAGDN